MPVTSPCEGVEKPIARGFASTRRQQAAPAAATTSFHCLMADAVDRCEPAARLHDVRGVEGVVSQKGIFTLFVKALGASRRTAEAYCIKAADR
jgi:hypothetical protein